MERELVKLVCGVLFIIITAYGLWLTEDCSAACALRDQDSRWHHGSCYCDDNGKWLLIDTSDPLEQKK